MAAARFQAAQRVLCSLGPDVTRGRSTRDLQRWMAQLLSLAVDAPPALLTDASLDLIARVAKAAVRWAA